MVIFIDTIADQMVVVRLNGSASTDSSLSCTRPSVNEKIDITKCTIALDILISIL